MTKLLLGSLTACLLTGAANAQQPVIDVHVHASLPTDNGPLPSAICVPVFPSLPAPISAQVWPEQFGRALANPPCDDPVGAPGTDEALMLAVIDELEKNNAVGILSGPPDRVNAWKAAAPKRFIKSLQLNVTRDPYTAEDAREYFADGGFLVLGEVSNQYNGVEPDDPRMQPFWAMAEEMGVPVQIHMGGGPPGAAAFFPDYRVAHGNPLLLEPILARHPRLRLSIQHMAEGFHDELIMMLRTYPQIYVDIGGVMWAKEPNAFYRQLADLVDAGFANRVMFGADAMTWPGLISHSVEMIADAEFLTEQQRADILFNNAVRFFGFDEDELRHRALGR